MTEIIDHDGAATVVVPGISASGISDRPAPIPENTREPFFPA
jgi:hypothetical protein